VSPRVALALVVFLALVGLAAIFVWPAVDTWRPTATGVSSDWYEIHFTTPTYPDRPETRRGGIDERLVALIDSAQRTVDIAVYEFDLQNAAQAMARAKARGVTLRMVTDSDTLAREEPTHRDQETRNALRTVRTAGIPIVGDNRRAIMHHKFAVVDGTVVLTGSWNFTVGDTYRLNNNVVIFRVPQLAANFSAEFEKMFTQGKFGPTKPKDIPYAELTVDDTLIETHFASQVDPSPRLVEVLRNARSRIDFLAFSFTRDDMGDAMMERARAGVKVRGVFEKTGSETRFSEYGRLKEVGADVYQDANPYTMHHKVIVVDERITVFGSFNFSNNAAEDNDENLLIVHSPAFARAYLAEVDRVVAQAKAGPPPR
jgi:phosphatidylserine/phosphatidylglycerophosphate/cardiolipin synthase-like enzyme